MNKFKEFFFVFFLFFVASNSYAQYYGLQFYGHDVDLDGRTGLDLFPGKAVSVNSDVELRFDFKFEPNQEIYFGYIFRCIFGETNIDLISSPHSEGSCNLHLVVGDRISNISLTLPLEELTSKWNNLRFRFNIEEQQIYFQFGDTLMWEKVGLEKDLSRLKLFFGAHRYERFNSTDVPGMNLREIELYSGQKREYYWPMRQYSGSTVVEKMKNRNGNVINPNWIIHLHSSWRIFWEKTFPGYVNYSYNPKTNELVFFMRDSLVFYDISSLDIPAQVLAFKGVDPSSRTNLIYDCEDELILYSLDGDEKIVIDREDEKDYGLRVANLATNHWHHNRLINPENGVLFAFGGYGQLKYSNMVYRFNDRERRWDTVHYNGNFDPRYLSGMAYNPADSKAYILGGYGSVTGNQEIAPRYYYNLLSYSFKENIFEVVHEFENESGDFCFSRNMVIDTVSNQIYGLRYSKLDAQSTVQAVAVSLDDYSLCELGDTFSYDFLDIRSTLDLFYSSKENRLFAISSYYNGTDSKLKIFEIAYPPLNLNKTLIDSIPKKDASLIMVVIFVTLASLFIFIFFYIRRKRPQSEEDSEKQEKDVIRDVPVSLGSKKPKSTYFSKEVKPGSIIVFGGFQVIDKEGKDITNSFSTLLKELFLYIMLPSVRFDKGVSSSALNEVFWFDKSDKAARNNRAVNIAKLRSLLESVGNCRISKDTGYWKFEFDPASMYVDYYEYQQIFKNDTENEKSMVSLLSIIHRGAALSNIQADWLDDFKSELSNEIIDGILEYVDIDASKLDPDFIIQLINCIFYFDTVNERAMSMKCKLLVSLGKHSLAKKAYEKFIKEYQTLYGEAYQFNFNQILVEDIS